MRPGGSPVRPSDSEGGAEADFVRLRRMSEQHSQDAKEYREAFHRAVSEDLGGASTTIW